MLKTLRLSANGIKNIKLSTIYDNEEMFTFKFGKKEIEMHRFLADFISPIAGHLHYEDPTINNLDLTQLNNSNLIDTVRSFNHHFLKNLNDENCLNYRQTISEYFSQLLTDDTILILKQISNGFEVTINEIQSLKLRILSIFLGNEELYNQIEQLFPLELKEKDLQLCLEYLKEPFSFEFFSTFLHEIIDFVAKNFYAIDRNDLLELPCKILYLIISNDNLRIESEDSLLNFINDIDQKDKLNNNEFDFMMFYEKIDYKALSESSLQSFLKNFDYSHITKGMWSKFSDCMYYSLTETKVSTSSSSNNRYTQNSENAIIELSYDGHNRFDGIINYLTKKCDGNVHTKGIVNVTASSEYYGYVPQNAVDLENDNSFFFSENKEDSWLCYDFKNYRIQPTHYSIKSRPYNGFCGSHLENWIIEASNDGLKWIKLDRRNNESSLNGKNYENTFTIDTSNSSFYQYLRIRQTDTNSGGHYFLDIGSLEYFGSIKYISK